MMMFGIKPHKVSGCEADVLCYNVGDGLSYICGGIDLMSIIGETKSSRYTNEVITRYFSK